MNTEGIVKTLLEMTWYNPLFMINTIGAIWFIPGIIIRRVAEKRYLASKAKKQADAIERLYPKK